MAYTLPDMRKLCLLDAARSMASTGFRVVPFKSDRSGAYVRYANEPARSESCVEYDFSRWPKALLAIHLPKDLVVLDLDPRNQSLGDIITELNSRYCLPPGPTVQTPKGGLHYWFQMPRGKVARNWTSQHGRFPVHGVDIRGYRGLAILPPSQRADGAYRWCQWMAQIPLASDGLVEALAPQKQASTPTPLSASVVKQDRNHDGCSRYGSAALRGELERVGFAPYGNRNHILFCATARLSELHFAGHIPDPRPDLFQMCRLNGLLGDDGERAVRATIESAWRRSSRDGGTT